MASGPEPPTLAWLASAHMITIQIPAWLQWAALGLAVAYAVPRALRAALVATFWLTKLVRGRWAIRTRIGDDDKSVLTPLPVSGNSKLIWEDLRNWALGMGVVRLASFDQRSKRSPTEGT